MIPICPWFGTVHKRSQIFYHKTWRNNSFSKVAACTIKLQKSVPFYTSTNTEKERERERGRGGGTQILLSFVTSDLFLVI